jgi:hypothetical protein
MEKPRKVNLGSSLPAPALGRVLLNACGPQKLRADAPDVTYALHLSTTFQPLTRWPVEELKHYTLLGPPPGTSAMEQPQPSPLRASPGLRLWA